uniref:(northern house mosquito) hypothetical protein n=1 Tax=Culex pipiens TaxID=7175 RepID=A0A8D8J3V3_CULPI
MDWSFKFDSKIQKINRNDKLSLSLCLFLGVTAGKKIRTDASGMAHQNYANKPFSRGSQLCSTSFDEPIPKRGEARTCKCMSVSVCKKVSTFWCSLSLSVGVGVKRSAVAGSSANDDLWDRFFQVDHPIG